MKKKKCVASHSSHAAEQLRGATVLFARTPKNLQKTMYNNLDKHVTILNKSVGYYQEHVNYDLNEKVSGALSL